MAFNFNWTPLSTTSSEFYNRAKDLLTTALNKAPKPPIIVDDIYVEELNLGSTAPELEILEIGDLAEDRFRGVFKLSYGGNAELTLKTKVQVCEQHLSQKYMQGLAMDVGVIWWGRNTCSCCPTIFSVTTSFIHTR